MPARRAATTGTTSYSTVCILSMPNLRTHSFSLTILLLSNVLLVLKVALVFVLDEVPSYIRRELANHRVAQVQMNVRQRLLRHSETAHARTIGAPASPESDAEPLFAAINPMSAAAGLLGSVPSRMVTSIGGRLGLMRTRSPLPAGDATHHAACGIEAEVHSREQDAARDATMAKLLEEQTSRKFGFEPLSLTLLVALPPLLQHLGAPLWLYGPAALLYFSYLQATKNRDDRKMAMGIVSDPTLVKLGTSSDSTVFCLFAFLAYLIMYALSLLQCSRRCRAGQQIHSSNAWSGLIPYCRSCGRRSPPHAIL